MTSILIVDDDADIREALRGILEEAGYEVADAAGAWEALAYLRDNPPPALILLDWNMTPLNALGFRDEYARQPAAAAVPVVIVSADGHLQEKAARYGGADCLGKPVDLDRLFGLVNKYVRAAG